MAVPGAVLPVAGVSYVSVLPTYRRRGILRSLMRRQLSDIATRAKEPIAALWASETPLYGRYGYGRASSHAYFRFGRGEGALAPTAPSDPALSLRLAEPAAAVADLAKVYDAVLPGQPGFFTRSQQWWERILGDQEEDRHGVTPLRCVLAEDHAGARGYALYTAARGWEDGTFLPDSALTVKEVMAADPAAGAALWRDLLSRDLVTKVTADLRPADDPLLYQLLDPRRARPQVADNLWVRIIDLPAALSRRAYSGPVDAVLEVTDELLPGNGGRWRLRTHGPDSGASCEQTHRAGRRRTRHQGTRRGLPRRHPAWSARGGRPGHRAAARCDTSAFQCHVMGPSPVVPDELLAGPPPVSDTGRHAGYEDHVVHRDAGAGRIAAPGGATGPGRGARGRGHPPGGDAPAQARAADRPGEQGRPLGAG